MSKPQDESAGAAGLNSAGPNSAYEAIVVGAGFAGMYSVYRLREAGIAVRALERGHGVGGTWYWNRYPGARVDSPSMQYSLSFSSELEQQWEWSEFYSPQPDLEKYANHVADRFDLRRDIQFGTTVTRVTYDEAVRRWIVDTDTGESFSAKYLIAASGCLSDTNVPKFTGLDSFGGTWYHTSRWPKEGVDLSGRRVGIVGTGSTGIQAVPVLAEQAAHLFVFQRTPNFSLPSNNKPMDREFEADWKRNYAANRDIARHSRAGNVVKTYPDRSALEVSDTERNEIFESAWGQYVALLSTFNDITKNPEANALVAEFVRNKIRQTVNDPVVAELLAPKDYPIGTKRTCVDSGYYETFNRDNVTLVDVKTNPIEEITPTGLRTSAASYDVDVLVFATGFDAITGPLIHMNITGRGGVTLAQKWEAGPRAYLGLVSSGFPNLFMITGPGSPSVLSNMVTSIEQHVDFVLQTIKYMKANDVDSIDASIDAEDAWVEHVNDVADLTLYPQANSWYMGANIPGKPRIFMPYIGGVGAYRAKCDAVAANNYEGFVLAG
jgi:cation diffusion facilitator CzcD-associated flavoprotein CzcO